MYVRRVCLHARLDFCTIVVACFARTVISRKDAGTATIFGRYPSCCTAKPESVVTSQPGRHRILRPGPGVLCCGPFPPHIHEGNRIVRSSVERRIGNAKRIQQGCKNRSEMLDSCTDLQRPRRVARGGRGGSRSSGGWNMTIACCGNRYISSYITIWGRCETEESYQAGGKALA